MGCDEDESVVLWRARVQVSEGRVEKVSLAVALTETNAPACTQSGMLISQSL